MIKWIEDQMPDGEVIEERRLEIQVKVKRKREKIGRIKMMDRQKKEMVIT